MSSLQKMYKEVVQPELKRQFSYKNVMQVPRVKKVVLNVGFGRQAKDKNVVDGVERTIAAITGQKPIRNKAKKSISNFKIRQGMEIGASVTLRGKNMYEFLYRLINLTLPRVRDFRGLNPESFDRGGNYTIGFKESYAFPEMGADSNDLLHGIEVSICTSAKNKEEARALLQAIGIPFKK
ncbi:MAG: 50S ribosomal protein L5 [Candidatus Magasanikbacteria bacterium]|nr:50S ribosomal protein L5 [Candidatus Magasanikbacteria bacterium]